MSARPTRRGVLAGGVGITAAVALGGLGGCAGSSHGAAPSSSRRAGTGTYAGDLAVAALGAALENLTVQAYTTVSALLARQPDAPAAATALVATALGHHRDHAAAWNNVLTRGGKPTVTTPAVAFAAAGLAKVGAAQTAPDALRALAVLESSAAATYLQAVGSVTDGGTIVVASTIAPVEAQHAAVIAVLLGTAPAPATYLTTSGAVGTDQLTA